MKKKQIFYLVLLVLIVLATLAVVFIFNGKTAPQEAQEAQLASELMAFPDRTVTTVEHDGPEANKKTISVATVEDGLRKMGVLITGEYYFTEAISYSNVKSWLGFDIAATETSYLVTYDGVVTAGLDFAAVTVTLDEENLLCTVTLPAARIRNVDIDTESFTLVSEKSGVFNPLSASDYNSSLKELEANAREKAAEKGLLERADENAAELVRSFVCSLVEPEGYTVVIAKG